MLWRLGKRFLVACGLLLGLALVGIFLLAAFLSLLDLDRFRQPIAQLGSRLSGRTLVLNGPIKARFFGSPGIDIALHDLSWANAAWAQEAGPLVSLARVHVKMAFWPLLRGRLHAERIELERLHLELVSNAAGEGSWQFDRPKSEEPQRMNEDPLAALSSLLEDLVIDDLQVSDLRLHWRDQEKGLHLPLRLLEIMLHLDGPKERLSFAAHGSLAASPLEAAIELSEWSRLKQGALPQLLRLKAAVAENWLRIEPDHDAGDQAYPSQAIVQLRAPHLDRLKPWLGRERESLPALSLNGLLHARPNEGRVDVESMLLELGQSRLRGKLSFIRAQRAEAKPTLMAAIEAPLLRYDDLKPFLAERSEGEEKTRADSEKASSREALAAFQRLLGPSQLELQAALLHYEGPLDEYDPRVKVRAVLSAERFLLDELGLSYSQGANQRTLVTQFNLTLPEANETRVQVNDFQLRAGQSELKGEGFVELSKESPLPSAELRFQALSIQPNDVYAISSAQEPPGKVNIPGILFQFDGQQRQMHLSAEGHWHDEPLQLNVSAGPWDEDATSWLWIPLHVHTELAGNHFDLQGKQEQNAQSWHAELRAPKLARLNRLLRGGGELALLPELSLQATFILPHEAAHAALRGEWLVNLGASDLKGELLYTGAESPEAPHLNVAMHSKRVDPHDLVSFQSVHPSPQEGEPGRKKAEQGSAPAGWAQPLPELLRRLEGELTVRLDTLGAEGQAPLAVDNHLRAHFARGEFILDEFLAHRGPQRRYPLRLTGRLTSPARPGTAWRLQGGQARLGQSALFASAALDKDRLDVEASAPRLLLSDLAAWSSTLAGLATSMPTDDKRRMASLSKLHLHLPLERGKATLVAAGEWAGVPLAMRGRGSSLEDFLKAEATAELDAKLGSNQVRLKSTRLPTDSPYDWTMAATLKGTRLEELAALAGQPLKTAKPLPALMVSAALDLRQQQLSLRDLELSYGQTKLQGTALWQKSTAGPRVKARLDIANLDAGDLESLRGPASTPIPSPKPRPKNPAKPSADWAVLQELNGELDLTLRRLSGFPPDLPLRHARVHATLKQGVMHIAPVLSMQTGAHAELDSVIVVPGKQSEPWKLSNLSFRTGESRLALNGELRLAGDKPRLRLALVAPRLKGDDLQALAPALAETLGIGPWPPKGESSSAGVSKPEKKKDEDKKAPTPWLFASDEPIPVELLNRLHLQLDAEIQHYDGLFMRQPMEQLDLSAHVEAGKATIRRLRVGLAPTGSLSLQGELVEHKNELALSAKLAFSGLRLGPLLAPEGDSAYRPITPVSLIRAKLKGWGELRSHGRVWRELARHSDGALRMTTGGQHGEAFVNAALVEFMGGDLTEGIASLIGYTPPTEIECFISELAITSGIVAPRHFVLATADSNITVRGGLDLAEGLMDWLILTYPRDLSIGSVRTPFRIRGRLPEVEAKPVYSIAAVKAGSAVVLGAFVNPLLGLLPFVETGPGSKGVCSSFRDDVQSIAQQSERRLRELERLAH